MFLAEPLEADGVRRALLGGGQNEVLDVQCLARCMKMAAITGIGTFMIWKEAQRTIEISEHPLQGAAAPRNISQPMSPSSVPGPSASHHHWLVGLGEHLMIDSSSTSSPPLEGRSRLPPHC